MKARDLSVGMCVAVKNGTRVKKAWVLEVGTAWYWSYTREWQCRRGLRPYPKLSVLGTNTPPRKRRTKKPHNEPTRWREREFQERFDKLNLSDAQLEANGYVRISLDALEALSRRRVDGDGDSKDHQ